MFEQMKSAIKSAQELTRNLGTDMASFGGLLRCKSCGYELPLDAQSIGYYLGHGWPKHCEHTMSWLTQKILDEYRQESNAALMACLEKRSLNSWGERSFIKGWVAAEHGQTQSDCPYKDHRTDSGKVTFSRAYRKVWERGAVAFITWRTSKDVVVKYGNVA